MATTQTLQNTLILPKLSGIPSLRFRPFKGKEDYGAIAKVIQRSFAADEIRGIATVEDVANSYEHLVNCNPDQDMLMVEIAGELVGYARVTWRKLSDGSRIYHHLAYLIPEWRRKGIGSAMLHFAESRLRRIAYEHPHEEPKFFLVEVNAREKAKIALLEREHYRPTRYFMMMVRDLNHPMPEAPMPAEVEVRPVKPEHYRLIWDAKSEAFQDHWGYVPPTEEEYQTWVNSRQFQPDLWKIAWDGDQVVGTVLGYIDTEENKVHQRKRGYTEDISVRKPWRRCGVARSLLVQCMRTVKQHGMTEAALGVDTKNPNEAARLYASVGFCPDERLMAYRKPLKIEE